MNVSEHVLHVMISSQKATADQSIVEQSIGNVYSKHESNQSYSSCTTAKRKVDDRAWEKPQDGKSRTDSCSEVDWTGLDWGLSVRIICSVSNRQFAPIRALTRHEFLLDQRRLECSSCYTYLV